METHLNGKGRSLEAARLSAQIAEMGVKYIYYQIISLRGRVLGKATPAEHFQRAAEQGLWFHPTALPDAGHDRYGKPIGFGVEASDVLALPDLDTFAVLPWDPEVGRFFCKLYYGHDQEAEYGSPLDADVRGNLERRSDQFKEALHLTPKSGCEPEMSWFRPGEENGVSGRGFSPGYHIGHFEELREVMKRVVSYSQAMGLDMIQGDYEDFGQLELNFAFDDVLKTADNLTTYRQVCIQVARELGVKATFMAKPLEGVFANGCHHSLSLWRDDSNTFVDESRTDLHLTDVSRHALGGLVAHGAGMTAVLASTVNSYARFWDAGLFAPNASNWGFDNRSCNVRVTPGRLEHKTADASVNPYLSHAVLLAAMREGIERELDPGAPVEGSSYELADAAASEHQAFPALPKTLGEALEIFQHDPVVRRALPGDLFDIYLHAKRDEWERYCAAVTDWQRDMYFDAVP